MGGRLLGGRYRLGEAIGTGGSGTVYLADDLSLGRQVAVKVLHSSLVGDEAFVERFRSEARLVASLADPHVVSIFDWGVDGQAYLVTEYLGGGSLRSILSAGRTLSPSQMLMVSLEACRALEITVQTYYRWRQKYGGMQPAMAKQLKALQKENSRLKKVVAEQVLDMEILREAAQGNW